MVAGRGVLQMERERSKRPAAARGRCLVLI